MFPGIINRFNSAKNIVNNLKLSFIKESFFYFVIPFDSRPSTETKTVIMVSVHTHSYDGKLKHYKTWMEEDKKQVSWLLSNTLSFEKALAECKIENDKRECSTDKKARTAHCLLLFASKTGNYDPTSDLSVEMVFPVIWAAIRSLPSRIPEKDCFITKEGFFEQLADVIQGSCAQGRVTRLLNYYSLIRS